ncbi:MAG: ATP-binding protein [Bacteroides sp.]|nr:ATP-binding protein [Bacteroides sp.]
MERREKYAIGEQDFRMLREAGAVYVDKTEFIERIIHSGLRYYFLARPRRFGKSLFLSTLRYFFEGRRELFSGLYIDSVDWDWKSYPVLHLDLNMDRYDEPGILDGIVSNLFREWEEKYEVTVIDTNISVRFRNIIKAAHEKTGLPVVILVDEYDKPLVGNLNKEENFEHYRSRLASLYSNFKSSAEHIRLVFMTGVSRFSKLSVFSDLNNIVDITFSDEYADICGITEQELFENLREGIEILSEYEGWSFEEACERLKKNYDGYRFARRGSDIYNPWSLLNCLNEKQISNYWNFTGFPTLIAESLKRVDADLSVVFDSRCSLNTLKGMDLLSPDPLALLYQTGYLTIKDYDSETSTYSLGIPNNEVKEGLMNTLLPFYVQVKRGMTESVVFKIIDSIRMGNPEAFMKELQVYFAGIPYELKMDNENNFQNAFYILMSLIGIKAHAEVSMSSGRIDLLIETPKYVYVIELKYDHSAETALKQIEERGYSLPYEADGRKIFKIGVSFSSKTRRIESWKIAE